ncbi:ankyrin repeat domain-containing protein [Leptospira gomenensis]|uniref:Ankyrin repeat domain-containing protein n=1 Tax=Leptospira gomenensis TaxID=2484974 RepID=A0A5F1YD23_9LEPT|nr:ankyrin repeat domain-containing protein [Leptospira gomenensis]TGK35947.1 ankyrin repeat domain-containing protein [Leptospira gomenensis]TGK40021.1 ankyrin repeat domain-containing protein [Leptospira gomenensis]TGK51471.1 ankyrin repeat domain-containing protein [Leptospira gomenensis]TGK68028.1 ankyrin repeat domain-containing protein [Leptospira gomenensis]
MKLSEFFKRTKTSRNIGYFLVGAILSLSTQACILPQEKIYSANTGPSPTDFVYRGDLEGLENSLRSGKGVDQRDPFFRNYTPLMVAAREGEYLIAEFLIRKGADVNARTRDGHTALMMAAFNRYPQIVKLLIRSGADVNASTVQGHTAWTETTLEDYKKVQDILSEYGAGPKR